MQFVGVQCCHDVVQEYAWHSGQQERQLRAVLPMKKAHTLPWPFTATGGMVDNFSIYDFIAAMLPVLNTKARPPCPSHAREQRHYSFVFPLAEHSSTHRAREPGKKMEQLPD